MRRLGPAAWFALLSLGLHLVWFAWLPATQLLSRAAEPIWMEVSYEASPSPAHEPTATSTAASEAGATPASLIADRAAPTAVESAAKPATTVSRAQVTSQPNRAVVASARRPAEPSAAERTAAPTAAAPDAVPRAQSARPSPPQLSASDTSPPPTAASPPQLLPKLSARAAAISLEAEAPALRCSARRDAPEPADCGEGRSDTEAAQAALSADLRAVARTVPHLSPRDRPELRARSDGSYTYEGHVFHARVRPDGQVEFNDQVTEVQLRASFAFFKVIADVNDIVEKHALGRELYSAEKQWFLEQTRELRDRLAQRYRERELQQARRALERTLQDVLADASLSVAQKHSAVFVLWQDCGEDEQAEQRRRAVEAFVRRNMPRGSALEFRASELDRLNTGRAGLRPFQPYSEG